VAMPTRMAKRLLVVFLLFPSSCLPWRHAYLSPSAAGGELQRSLCRGGVGPRNMLTLRLGERQLSVLSDLETEGDTARVFLYVSWPVSPNEPLYAAGDSIRISRRNGTILFSQTLAGENAPLQAALPGEASKAPLRLIPEVSRPLFLNYRKHSSSEKSWFWSSRTCRFQGPFTQFPRSPFAWQKTGFSSP
jgi:hypothetical protein